MFYLLKNKCQLHMVGKNVKIRCGKKQEKSKGNNPDKYRTDVYGNTMYYGSYGKTTSMGWQIDHMKPKSKGGSNKLKNLQALNSKKKYEFG